MAVQRYRDLLVWQKAMDLVEAIYRVSAQFPQREIYGLTAQIRRAGVSIPSNIAEGQGRGSVGEFLHFLGIARGSLQEAVTQALVALRLQYADEEQIAALLELSDLVGRLLNGLCNSLTK